MNRGDDRRVTLVGTEGATGHGRGRRRVATCDVRGARRRSLRPCPAVDQRGPSTRGGSRAGDVVAGLATSGGSGPQPGFGAGVAVHDGAQPGDRLLAASVGAGRRGRDRRAAGGAHRGRDGPHRGSVADRRGALPALHGASRGPGGVLLPGAVGGRGVRAAGGTPGHDQVPHALRVTFVTTRTGGDGGDAMRCTQTVEAGSYVLGALAPAERSGYEQHIATCAECRNAVAELAGLPGLLGRLG